MAKETTTGTDVATTTDPAVIVDRKPPTKILLAFCVLFVVGGVGHILLTNSAGRAAVRAQRAEARASAAEERAEVAAESIKRNRQEIERLSREHHEERRKRELLEAQVRSLGERPVTERTTVVVRPGASPDPSSPAGPSASPKPTPKTPSPTPGPPSPTPCPLPICLPPLPVAQPLVTPPPA